MCAWTAPRDWATGEVVTEAMMDTHVKDNLRYLKGLDGVPTIESGLIIDNTDGDEYLQIPSLTTVERDALTPVNGMVIYNETTTEFNKYEAGAWVDLADNTDHGGLDGLADDDHSAYQNVNLLTTQADIIYATAASTWARLAKGTGLQVLRMNSGATAPEWGTAAVRPATQTVVTGSRALNTTYQNTTGYPMFVAANVSDTGATKAVTAKSDSNATPTTVVISTVAPLIGSGTEISFWVLDNNYYRIESSADTLNVWTEWD